MSRIRVSFLGREMCFKLVVDNLVDVIVLVRFKLPFLTGRGSGLEPPAGDVARATMGGIRVGPVISDHSVLDFDQPRGAIVKLNDRGLRWGHRGCSSLADHRGRRLFPGSFRR